MPSHSRAGILQQLLIPQSIHVEQQPLVQQLQNVPVLAGQNPQEVCD
jgi:hypothetical protein